MVQLTVPGSYTPTRIKAELTFPGAVAKGAKGMKARRVQEWLTLHGFGLSIDSDFGGATETQAKAFQTKKGLPATGVVDQATWNHLVEPLVKAVAPVPAGPSLSATIVAVAAQHVAQHPREAGGDNKGPWVRAYLGWDGAAARWCAGFTCTSLEQASKITGVAQPFPSSAGCDALALMAKQKGKFLKESAATPASVPPGSFFLVRAAPNDWIHVGIVTSAAPSAFQTLEGNTNDEGSANGFEACARARGYKAKDFIVW